MGDTKMKLLLLLGILGVQGLINLTGYMDYILYTCDNHNLTSMDCAKRLAFKINRRFGDKFHCVVSKEPYPDVDRTIAAIIYGATVVTHSARHTEWLGTCARSSSRTVDKHLADLLCGGAYNHCEQDVTCMGEYIDEKFKSGAVEMCGESYNLIVSDARNDISGHTYGGYVANDGHYAKCFFYCAA